jgi:hypothetical protein
MERVSMNMLDGIDTPTQQPLSSQWPGEGMMKSIAKVMTKQLA